VAVRRILFTLPIALALLVSMAPPAAAHTVNGAGASNFETVLRTIEPATPGLGLRVIEGGSRLELTNDTQEEVVVSGYQDEPYLRIGPDGVFENERSPATYLNKTRGGDEPIPPDADPEATPRWKKVSDGNRARWHDHRTHWMGASDPPGVQRNPGRQQAVIEGWKVAMQIGGRQVVASGDLLWVPGPSPVPWYAIAAVLAVFAALAGRTSRWRVLLTAAVAVLVVVDVVHGIGIAGAAAGGLGSKIGALFASTGVFSIVAWVAGIAAVVLLLRESADGLFLAIFAGLAVALFGGLADSAVLRRSQVPFAWDADIARFTVAVSLGLGAGVIAGAAMALRRLPAVAPAPSETDEVLVTE
jgi:hypothetical protein